jgi:hypothetical protein
MSTDVSEVRAASIIGAIAVLEAARTFKTSVDFQLITRQYIPEDSELHTLYAFNPKEGNSMILQNGMLLRVHMASKPGRTFLSSPS